MSISNAVRSVWTGTRTFKDINRLRQKQGY